MRAFIFPGQGSQSVGMGKALAEASSVARHLFEEVDEALRQKLFRLMAEGPQDELTLTENAQPAIMANAVATFRVSGIAIDKADFVAGHSLGEYSALCAAGSFGLPTTARLLKLRGEAMQRAVPVGQGAMAALLGAGVEIAQAVADAAAQGEICVVANDNDPSQVVISGHRGAVERALEIAKEKGAKRAILLPVSAPFHSPMMEPAALEMEQALAGVEIRRRCRTPTSPPRRWKSRTRSAASSSSRSPAWSAGARASPPWPRRESTISSSSEARSSPPW